MINQAKFFFPKVMLTRAHVCEYTNYAGLCYILYICLDKVIRMRQQSQIQAISWLDSRPKIIQIKQLAAQIDPKSHFPCIKKRALLLSSLNILSIFLL